MGRTSCFLATALTALALLGAGCSSPEHFKPRTPDGGWVSSDADAWMVVFPDAASGATPDGLPVNAKGPTITFIAPLKDQLVVEPLFTVVVKVTDPDGVDPSSVSANLTGQLPVPMSPGKAPDTFEALVDLSAMNGTLSLWVVAADVGGQQNSATQQFRRDAGPVIEFLAPTEGGHYKGSVLVKVAVEHLVPLESFELSLGKDRIPMTESGISPTRSLYSGTVTFDDPFDPPLSGKQVFTAIAVNKNKAQASAQRVFFVDNEGPAITILSQTAGEIIGGTIKVQAKVTDPAGVLDTSVQCVIGDGSSAQTISLKPVTALASVYEGQFDSRTFTTSQLWPIMSYRAADVLGNESHLDIQVGLDNGPPIVELDPQSTVFIGRQKAKILQCSHPIYDAVGEDAASDAELVPQVVPIRARIEDQGNSIVPSKFVPIALVDPANVWLYVLDESEKPLLIDSTGDGFCDAINPEVVPLSSVHQQGKAHAVNLAPIPVSGGADFTPWADGSTKIFPFPICKNGDDPTAPDPLCQITELTIPIFYPTNGVEPAIYTVPPIGGKLQCLGLPFDFGANTLEDGWVCAAASALDRAGNLGVSPPLRLWVEKAAPLSKKGASPPGSAGAPPDCTGTLDPGTGKVDGTKPCKIRTASESFPQRFPAECLYLQ